MIICAKCKLADCEEQPYSIPCNLMRYGFKMGVADSLQSISEWAKIKKGIDLKPLLEEWRASNDSSND